MTEPKGSSSNATRSRRTGLRSEAQGVSRRLKRAVLAARAGKSDSYLEALREWWTERKPRQDGEKQPEPCNLDAPDPCAELSPAHGPEQIVIFRQSFRLETLSVDLGDPVESGGPQPLEFSCVPVAKVDAAFGLDLRYEQRWLYEKPLRGALSASVALAPGETLAISIRNTQRKRFDRETVDEVERTEAAESTIADRDVLNVTRSSSQTNSWNVSGNASLSLSAFSLGASGSVSESVTEALSSSAQRTSEATRKSSENLKTLRKVQIKESSELTVEQGQARTIVNPYRDRTLRVDAYEMLKSYCVEFHMTDSIPAILLTIERLIFDRAFVLTNGAFLSEELIDRWLAAELTDALQGRDLRPASAQQNAQQEAETIALLALNYLFSGPDIFNWPVPLTIAGIDIRPANWDENRPENSFANPMGGQSGFGDAVENHFGIVFTALASYYGLYRDEVLAGGNRALGVQLAMSLDKALGPRWLTAEETDDFAAILDSSQATEVLRRLSGFLAMTSGILLPLLQPAEEEQAARRAAEAAEFTIDKVVEHLRCHEHYYTERYLASMAQLTRMQAVHKLVFDVLDGHVGGGTPQLWEIFDSESSYLDARTIVIPLRAALTPEEPMEILNAIGAGEVDLEPRLLRVDELTVPTDGIHMEALAGECVLEDVPDPPPLLPIQIVGDRERA